MSHGHGDNPYLGHHWDNMEQQFSSAKLGMWLFMAQEILFFSGLFCFYAVLRFNNPEAFEYGHQLLDKIMGAVNTIVLLLSSLTMALGVRAAQTNQKRATCIFLALTFLGGCGFMVIKGIEYNAKGTHGSLWGLANFKGEDGVQKVGFDYGKAFSTDLAPEPPAERAAKPEVASDAETAAIEPGGMVAEALDQKEVRSILFGEALPPPGKHGGHEEDEHAGDDGHDHGHAGHVEQWGTPPPTAHIFFSVYFGLTALHGIHVVVGMGLIAWVFVNARRGKYSSKYFTQVEVVGLYWHLVDLIWIFLFPLLYLIS